MFRKTSMYRNHSGSIKNDTAARAESARADARRSRTATRRNGANVGFRSMATAGQPQSVPAATAAMSHMVGLPVRKGSGVSGKANAATMSGHDQAAGRCRQTTYARTPTGMPHQRIGTAVATTKNGPTIGGVEARHPGDLVRPSAHIEFERRELVGQIHRPIDQPATPELDHQAMIGTDQVSDLVGPEPGIPDQQSYADECRHEDDPGPSCGPAYAHVGQDDVTGRPFR